MKEKTNQFTRLESIEYLQELLKLVTTKRPEKPLDFLLKQLN